MLNHFSILLAGFSIFSTLILCIAYLFFLPDMRKSTQGKIAASTLLISLASLQLGHYLHLSSGLPLLEFRAYGILLLLLPSTFFFFSRVVLFPDVTYQRRDLLHFIPFVLSFFLPITLLAPLGFLLGTAYTFWFAQLIFKLRKQSGRFKFELFFFGLFAIIALITLALCLSLPYINPSIYYIAYSNSIAVSMLLIISALLFFPKLLSDILIITELTYAKSKLSGVHTENKIAQLEQLMNTDKLYQNEELSLSMLAEQLELSVHQLSELINTHFDYGFSRYIREHRIREAKTLLVSQPDASVLSISMMTGFKSQSNFYTAFKEITGGSPGAYRKQ